MSGLKLDPADHPWLVDDGVKRIAVALHVAKPGAARFVGGCVRNALIGAPVDDLDMAVAMAPDDVVRALEAAGVKVAPTGIDHGTVTAVVAGRGVEITSLRADVKTDGRHAEVIYTEDWDLDWRRRDFTMNALYADLAGRVWDAPGVGLADARDGRVRFIGDAQIRVREDYLRILRFFRFLAWYGRTDVSKEGLAVCEAMRDGLARLSAERIAKELLKLLAAPDPRAAVRLMAERGIWAALDLPAPDLDRFGGLVDRDLALARPADRLLRLASLLPTGSGEAVAKRMKLSNADRRRLAAATVETFVDPPDDKTARALIHRHGSGAFGDLIRLSEASDESGDDRSRAWTAARAVVPPPAFPLSGADAVKAGLQPGPRVGEALKRVEDWWVLADFPDDRAALDAKLADAVRALS